MQRYCIKLETALIWLWCKVILTCEEKAIIFLIFVTFAAGQQQAQLVFISLLVISLPIFLHFARTSISDEKCLKMVQKLLMVIKIERAMCVGFVI